MTIAGHSERLAGKVASMTMHRIEAARHLLHAQQLRDSLALARQPFLRNAALAGLQAAAALAIALPLAHLSPWSHLIGFASLGALVALFGRFSPRGGRSVIVLLAALCQTLAVFVMSLAVWAGATVTLQLVVLALACGIFFFVTVRGRFGPPGALIFVFAAGASMAGVETIQAVLERTAATAAVAVLAWAICAASEALRHHATAERPFPADPLRPIGQQLAVASRVAIGTAAVLFVSHSLGLAYPAWAAMGALAVLQGAHLHISMNRALQRMTGTILGSVLAWAFLMQDPSIWTIFGLLLLLQFGTEMIIGSNYGLGQILVTPMALLMTHLASPQVAGAEMAIARVADTVLGATLGIAIAVLLSSLDERHRLVQHNAKSGRLEGEACRS